MKTRIAKWGNSLALRLPKALVKSFALDEGSAVELVDHADGILLRPAAKRYELKELLEGVNKDNLHEAEETGPPAGKEAW